MVVVSVIITISLRWLGRTYPLLPKLMAVVGMMADLILKMFNVKMNYIGLDRLQKVTLYLSCLKFSDIPML